MLVRSVLEGRGGGGEVQTDESLPATVDFIYTRASKGQERGGF